MVRIHGCSFAFAVCAFGLRIAAWADAASHIFHYEGSFYQPIPAVSAAGKGWMSDAVLDVPDHASVVDLDVAVTVTHTLAFDLQLFLRSPSGRRVLLNKYDPLTTYFPGADYDHTVFDDEAATGIQEGRPPFTGRFRPLKPLSVFDGEDAYGPWRLQIYDAFYYNTGWLDKFDLSITATPAAPAPSVLALVLIAAGLLPGTMRRVARSKRVDHRRSNA